MLPLTLLLPLALGQDLVLDGPTDDGTVEPTVPPYELSDPNPKIWFNRKVGGTAPASSCAEAAEPDPEGPTIYWTAIPVGPDKDFTRYFEVEEHVTYRVGSCDEASGWDLEDPPYERDGWTARVMYSPNPREQFNPALTDHPDWSKTVDVPELRMEEGLEVECQTVVGPDNNYEGEGVARVGLYSAKSWRVTIRAARRHILQSDTPDGPLYWAPCEGCGDALLFANLYRDPGQAFHSPGEPREWEPVEPQTSDFCSDDEPPDLDPNREPSDDGLGL